MSAVIKSASGPTELDVDPTSKAARTTLYDTAGNPVGTPTKPFSSILGTDPLRLGLYFASTFRTLGIAASPQNVAALLNPVGSGKVIRVRRVGVTQESTAALLTIANNFELSRPAALPTGGTALSPVKRATSDADAVGSPLGGTASNGGAATAIVATAGSALRSLFGARMATAAGIMFPPEIVLFVSDRPSDDIVLAAGEALLLQSLTNAAATVHMLANFTWEEYAA